MYFISICCKHSKGIRTNGIRTPDNRSSSRKDKLSSISFKGKRIEDTYASKSKFYLNLLKFYKFSRLKFVSKTLYRDT